MAAALLAAGSQVGYVLLLASLKVLSLLPFCSLCVIPLGFPGGSDSKESSCNAGDLSLIPGLGRSLGKGNSYPLQYSGLENSMDCIVYGVKKSRTQLSHFDFHVRREARPIPRPHVLPPMCTHALTPGVRMNTKQTQGSVQCA